MRFDSYHPMINLIYFVTAIVCAVNFDHPVYLAISFLCAFVYSIKLNGKRSLIFNLCLIPLIGAYTAWYSYYNHFGITNLRMNFIGNQITLEAVTVGIVRGTKIAVVIMIFSCIFAVVSADKVVYLFGRISPRLSLYLSILLRFVPRVKQRGRRIELSLQRLGKRLFSGQSAAVSAAYVQLSFYFNYLDTGGFHGQCGFYEVPWIFPAGTDCILHLPVR